MIPLSKTNDDKAMPINPLSVVYKQLDKKVIVHLKGGERYSGILAKVDNYMNVVLEDTIEEKRENKTARFGRVLIRGNNILLIQLE